RSASGVLKCLDSATGVARGRVTSDSTITRVGCSIVNSIQQSIPVEVVIASTVREQFVAHLVFQRHDGVLTQRINIADDLRGRAHVLANVKMVGVDFGCHSMPLELEVRFKFLEPSPKGLAFSIGIGWQ